MQRQRLLILAVLTLLVAGLVAPVASAQEGTCIAQGVYYQACWVSDNRLEVLRIDGGQGRPMGFIPGEIYAYAAANLTSPQLLYTLSDGSGYSVELYFTGKQLAPVNGYDTTWTLVYYGPTGQLTRTDYTKRAAADPTVSLSFAPGAGPARSGGAAAAAPVDVPVTGAYEPSIVQGGTVENCLVRSTFTVRMRQAPSTGGALMDRVPYDTSMPADMITTDGQWVRAFFVAEGGVGKLGWVFSRYLDLSEACAGLTTVMPLGSSANVAALVAAGGTSAADTASDPAPDAQGEAIDPTFGGQLDLTVTQSGSVGTCLVRTTYTVRMRAMPSVGAPEMDNVPYRSSMPADLVTSDGEWVRANYLGALGWINARYLSLSEACAGLSAIAPVE